MNQPLEYRRPKPCNISRDTIDRVVEEYHNKNGLLPDFPIEDLVKSLGGEIVYLDARNANDHDNGSIIVSPNEEFTIFLPPFTSATRDRFTIAHELGHFFLHFPIEKDEHNFAATRNSKFERAEWEANWFAAALLMPKKIFIEESSRLKGDTYLLSKAFLVSPEAVRVRKKVLNI